MIKNGPTWLPHNQIEGSGEIGAHCSGMALVETGVLRFGVVNVQLRLGGDGRPITGIRGSERFEWEELAGDGEVLGGRWGQVSRQTPRVHRHTTPVRGDPAVQRDSAAWLGHNHVTLRVKIKPCK